MDGAWETGLFADPGLKEPRNPILYQTRFHTWYGKPAHIVRRPKEPGATAVLRRCTIRDLSVVDFYGVVVSVSFYEDGKHKCKKVSPLVIQCLTALWADASIVSSVEQDDELTDVQVPKTLGDLRLTRVQKLPKHVSSYLLVVTGSIALVNSIL